MEVFLTYLNLLVSVLLAAVCVALYVDGRAQRVAVRAAQEIIAALQKQIAGQGQRIETLERALVSVAAGDPGGIKPTTQIQRPTTEALARAAVQPSRSAASVDRLVAEVSGAKPGAPVDTEGDRPGITPGEPAPTTPRSTLPGDEHRRTSSTPPPPVVVVPPPQSEVLSETPSAIRARIEAAENERHPEDAEEPDSEPTQMRAKSQAVPVRETLLGGLSPVGGRLATVAPPAADRESETHVMSRREAAAALAAAVPERMMSSAARAAAAAKAKRAGLGDTMVSAGVVVHVQREDGSPLSDRPARPETPTPTAPGQQLDPRVERRLAEKVAQAKSVGVDVYHCGSAACSATADGCVCRCGGCARMAGLLADAAREVLGGKS